MSLSCSQVEHFGIPSLETRLTGDTYNIHQTVGMMQRMGVRAPILLIGGLCFSFAMEARLALIMTAVLPLLGTGGVFDKPLRAQAVCTRAGCGRFHGAQRYGRYAREFALSRPFSSQKMKAKRLKLLTSACPAPSKGRVYNERKATPL